MRATVLASDLLIYIPALILFVRTWLKGRSSRTQVRSFDLNLLVVSVVLIFRQHLALFGLFLQPSLILIDSGHFQFNSIMLGVSIVESFDAGR